jgi:hypothetical protein
VSTDKHRSAVIAAEQKLQRERDRFRCSVQDLIGVAQPRRSWFVVGTGLAAGFVAARLPLAQALRSANAMIGIGTSLARTPVGAMLIRALVANKQADHDASTQG